MKRWLPCIALLLFAAPVHADEPASQIRVLSAAGRPLANAELVAVTPASERQPAILDARAPALAQTGADGWITVPANAPASLAVRARGFAPVRVPPGRRTASVRLLYARAIDGRVRLASPGSEPAALEVLALPTGAADLAHRTVAAEDGSYRFASLHDGIWLLAVRRPGGRLVSLGRVQAGATTVEHHFDIARQFRGALLDADKAESGAANVTVQLVRLAAAHVSPAPPLSATTDAQGRFAFGSVAPGTYDVQLDDPRWTFERRPPRVVVGAGDPPPEAAWYVVRCPAVRGQVVTPDKQPVANAAVAVLPPRAQRHLLRQTVQTGPDGAFEFPAVPPADGYQLLIVADGYGPWVSGPFDVPRISDTQLDPIRLELGWLLEVVVKDLAGHPLEGVSVRAAPGARPAAESGGPWEMLARDAVTDAQGMAQLADLPIDDAFVFVTAANRLSQRLRVEYPRTADRGRIDVVLEPAPALAGTVTSDAEDGGPYQVELRARDADELRTADTDAKGRFAVTGLRPIAYDVDVRRPDDGRLLARVEHVLPDVDVDLQIPLPALQRVQGRVFGLEEGGSLPVVVLESPHFDRTLERYVWTQERSAPVTQFSREGTFAIDDVRPGTYTLRVVQGGRATALIQVLVEDHTVEGISLRMADGARLAGLVFGTDSRPRQAVRITAEPLRGDGAARAPLSTAHEAYTDDDGAFVFESLAPGLWRTTAQVDGAAPRSVIVRLAPGESLVLDDIELGDGVHLRGRIADTEGNALDGVRVSVRRLDGSGREQFALSDAEGNYDVPDLVAGLYLVRLEGLPAQFLPADQAAVEIADEDVTLDFAPGEGAQLAAIVQRAGRVVAGAVVELIAIPDAGVGVIAFRRRLVTDGDGRALFQALAPGRYHVALEVGALRSERTVHVEAHDRLEVDLEAHEGRLRGRVFGPGGRPIAGAFIEARSRESEDVVAEGRTTGDGHFVLTGIPIAAYEVLVSAAGLPPARLSPAQAELSGSDFPYDIELGSGGNLEVRVLDDADVALVGAQVWVESDDGRDLHRWPFSTDQDGVTHIRGMPPGVVRVRVRARGYASSEPVLLTVADGATTEHRIVLGPPGSLRVVVQGAALDPIPRVRVDVLHAESGEIAVYRRPLRRLSAAEAGVLMPRAGSVALDDLKPGAYRVRVNAGKRYKTVERPVRVVVGQQALVEVQLEPK